MSKHGDSKNKEIVKADHGFGIFKRLTSKDLVDKAKASKAALSSKYHKQISKRSSKSERVSKISDDVPDLIRNRGYDVEVHTVVTEDGYILNMHRIPRGVDEEAPEEEEAAGEEVGKQEKIPVLLQHGMMGSSAVWVINQTENSLPFLLADAGYDVWLGNHRGNKYSREHVYLDPDKDDDKDDYWLHDWDEMGRYDLPAEIDHILTTTGHPSLFYVGHSMGTTSFFVGLSERPEYNDKIRAMFALGPTASIGNHQSQVMNILNKRVQKVEWLRSKIGLHEFLPSTALRTLLVGEAFRENGPSKVVSSNFCFLLLGYHQAQIDEETVLPLILAHTPAGVAVRTIIHYAQTAKSGVFARFDHGKTANLELYGQETPPEYDLKKITAPVALLWGQADRKSTPKDTEKIAAALGNLMEGGNLRMTDEEWNHLDFIWGKDAKTQVYDHVMALMENL